MSIIVASANTARVEFNDLEYKDHLYYLKLSNEPYTGKVVDFLVMAIK